MSIQTCSPDQSVLDFLLWGCVKDRVYSTTLSIPLGNLKLLAVCREMLGSVWRKKEFCFDVCRATKEGHIIVRTLLYQRTTYSSVSSGLPFYSVRHSVLVN